MSKLGSRVALESWLRARVAIRLHCAGEALASDVRFRDLGLDSAAVTALLIELSDYLGESLGPTVFWDHPTITSLAAYLTGGKESGAASRQSAIIRRDVAVDEPVAIVGMACRFPGSDGIDAYWHLLSSGIDAVTEVPAVRWPVAELFDTDRSVPGKSSTRWGGFVNDIGGFEPQFFGISPREAAEMDPQQRLTLELAWHAFEDAGIAADTLKGTRTGVFVGAMWSDYARLATASLEQIVQHTATGQDHSLIAGRISYLMGLEGPSLVLNTACSSSLVAVHLACQSLRSGESEMALAGGVSLMLSPYSSVVMSKFGAMSPNGRCRAFDAGADGYVRGEGGGLVVLKPLSRARAEGDRVYALVAGSAVNNDGWSNGLTAPSSAAQAAVLRDAYQHAGVAAEAVQYVETHGPGTILGDPIEAQSLGLILGSGRPPEQPLRIGSVKTNLGHLEAAAGIAGLIKTILSIHHRMLPGSLHFDAPNPHIAFAELGLEVQCAHTPWPRPDVRLAAGVSAFGFSGTNCHVVLHEPEPLVQAAAPRLVVQTPIAASDSSSSVNVLARPEVVFVCSGQGGQWHGMAVSLLHREPVFRAALQDVDRVLASRTGWSVVDELQASPARARLEEVQVAQPLLFALQVALGRLWQTYGIEPDVVVGHSMGEAAAAHLAGVLTLGEAARVIYHRSQLASKLAGQGAMAVVSLGAEATVEAIANHADEVSVAAWSSPESTVISGATAAVNAVLASLQTQGVYASRVNVDFASHSPQVEPLCAPLTKALAGLRPRIATRTLVSTVTGGCQPGPAWDAAYWGRNLRQPIRFTQAIAAIAAEGPAVFIELSPHPVLLKAVEETLAHHGLTGFTVPSLRREEDELAVLRASLATLASHAVTPESAVRCEEAVEESVPVLLPLSARDPVALDAQVGAHLARIERESDESLVTPSAAVQFSVDLAHAASVRRRHHAERLAVIGGSPTELVEALQHAKAGEPHAGLVIGRAGSSVPAKPIFVFPGQGAQWLGMGRQLWRREAVFRDAIVRCDDAIRRHAGWSLIDELWACEATSRLAEIDRVQPALFAIQVALADLWRSWGVEPGAVIGHSMGEAAAAYTAGALSLGQASAVICRRSKLLRRVSGLGAMALVELSREEALALLDETGQGAGQEASNSVSVAVSNSPSATVLSGEPTVLASILAEVEKRGVFCRTIQVDVASHSPQMDPILEPLLASLDDLVPCSASVPMHSTVLDRVLDGTELTAEYWARNLRQPVLFWNAVRARVEEGAETFIELSPHPVLLPSVVQGLRQLGRHRTHSALPSLRRGEDESRAMLGSLGALYVEGHAIDWRGVHPRGGRFVDLPLYPFQREHCWTEGQPAADQGFSETMAISGPRRTDMLGPGWVPAFAPARRCFDLTLRPEADPAMAYLKDNEVHGHALVPGTLFLELMRLAASVAVSGKCDAGAVAVDASLQDVALEAVRFDDLLLLPARGDRSLQVVLDQTRPRDLCIEVFAPIAEGAPADGVWPRYASARIVPAIEDAIASGDIDAAEMDHPVLPTADAAEAFLARLGVRGLRCGPAFQGLVALAVGEGRAWAHLALPPPLAGAMGSEGWHPALLEAAFQTLVAALPDDADTLYLSAGIDRLRFIATGARRAAAALLRGEILRAAARVWRVDGAWLGDLHLTDVHGSSLWVAEGVRLVPLGDGAKLLAIAAQRQLGGDRAHALRRELAAAPAGVARRALLEDHLRSALGAVLKLSPKRIEMAHSLRTYGTDSVMTLELRNRLEATFGLTLSASVIWNHPSLGSLIDYLAEQLGLLRDAGVPAAAEDTPCEEPTTVEVAKTLESLDPLEPVEAMLDRELALVDALLENA